MAQLFESGTYHPQNPYATDKAKQPAPLPLILVGGIMAEDRGTVVSTGNALLKELGLDEPQGLSLKRAEPLVAQVMRELEPADLLVAQTEGIDGIDNLKPIKSLRSGHHQLARLLAQGIKNVEISAITGYSPNRISILMNDPTFVELMEYYRAMEAEAYTVARADMKDRLKDLGFDAIETLHEKLLEEPDSFDPKTLLLIVEATSDRTGHGKTSTVNTNHVHELSEKSLAAIRLSGASARSTEADRSTLLSLAARQTAELHSGSEASSGGGSEGGGLREESIEGTAVDVTRESALPSVDPILRGRQNGLRGAGSVCDLSELDLTFRDEVDGPAGGEASDGGAVQAAAGAHLRPAGEVPDGVQVGESTNPETDL